MTRFLRLTAALVLLLPAGAARAATRAAEGSYHGAIVIDAASGQVLFEDHADVVSPPASMTKLMTFAVLHDDLAAGRLRLDTPVTVDATDSRIGGTQVWLKEKETFPVEELIYAMMIQSANDAAHALARAAAGSTDAFVARMNEKARALGMTHTTFRTPHGLPPADRRTAEGDLTSPRDYAVLSRYLLLETDITRYTSVRERKFGEGERAPGHVVDMLNHNHLLGRVAGVDGLKTGFTNGASFCLAATAERNGRRIIAVVMGSPNSKIRDLTTIGLLDRGFASAPAALPVLASHPAATPAPAGPDPVVKTDKTPAPAPSGPDPKSMFTFRVIPPEKKS